MAFYKSKFTGQEIDARLTQGTYDDAVKAGFKGTKEEFYALLGQLQETTDAATISQPAESDKLETFNKNIVDAINELHQELQAKPDKQDVIDQEELDIFKDEIAAKYATKEEITSKVDWVDYNDTKNIVLPSNGQVFGDFGGEESNSSLLGARIYNAGLENEEKQVEVGTTKVHLNLNSSDKPTIETPDGKENLVVESDIELIPIEVNFPIRTSGGSDGPEDRVYTQDEILEWFGVADIAALRKQITNKGIQYIKYGISLMGNPYYYRMPIQYAAFESANQIKLVFTGLNTNNDVVSKYEIIANLNGTIIEGNSNVKVTITSIESEDIDLSEYATKEELNDYALKSELPDVSNLATKSEVNSKQDTLVSGTSIKTINGESLLGSGDIEITDGSSEVTWDNVTEKPTFATVATSGDYNDLTNIPDLTVYQPITDNSLATSAKTIPLAINEIKESIASISDPYEINLTNLLSAEDSESISTAIGGIDNLNATVQDNRIIVGTISNGNVSVSIRILGNVTTLYYLLDSVVGLTLNEIAITNTSSTLSKRVTTHAVLTENMVINSLTSDETTLPLSAAQGKALNEKIQSSASGVYYTNMLLSINSSSSNLTDDDINQYIGSWDGLIAAIQSNTPIFDKIKIESSRSQYGIMPVVAGVTSDNTVYLVVFVGADKSYRQIHIIKTADNNYTLAFARKVILDNDNNIDLLTDNKTVTGAINELLAKLQELETKNTELESRLAALEGTN